MGSSAGGHLTLMGVTSSGHRSYWPIDQIDAIPCNVQWGIGIYPAYALTDGLFVHGDADKYASMASVKCWEKLRAMGIQSELHTLALRNHCFQRTASPGTGSYTWLDRIGEFLQPFIKEE